ncbi:uncharacterized protein LAESUDRAFT_732707 [Laetiporus sulphureus 93-53]|uniref:Uncharacterized protein n=1 Tax=Laetiporus sulphureus 93-53 TaxID=1314785 RepID=A0A165AZT6_9APHY|nr:uncharacterized protein LAESUDRAFT_732707 [Laetiporus sulphureus 93-53]KZS99962.1 hypothetical protein LAESUDRAFT_732707 [Laetiporus sulphureus 93-53]
MWRARLVLSHTAFASVPGLCRLSSARIRSSRVQPRRLLLSQYTNANDSFGRVKQFLGPSPSSSTPFILIVPHGCCSFVGMLSYVSCVAKPLAKSSLSQHPRNPDGGMRSKAASPTCVMPRPRTGLRSARTPMTTQAVV